MEKQTNESTESGKGLTADVLKGKQSVRATFRLPANVIELLSMVAGQLGIKQKSLFDQLIEDKNVLGTVADRSEDYPLSNHKKVQKTYVLSRNSLSSLDEIAREHNLSRDVLVEMSINRLRPVISAELEKHDKRKMLMSDMESILLHMRKAVDKSKGLLEENDPFAVIFAALLDNCEKKARDLGEILKKGEFPKRYNDFKGNTP